MNEEKPRYIWLIVILIVFLLTLGILVYYVRFRTSVSPNASSYNSTSFVSLSNSYVFASPVRAKASGDLVRVTVFLLDDEGSGIFDRKVGLRLLNGQLSGSIQIKDIQSLTDETGKAVFDVSASSIGTYTLEAFTDSETLSQKVKIVFD